MFSLCALLNKNKTKFQGFYQNYFVDFQNFQNSNFVRVTFLKNLSSTFPRVPRGPTKNLGPISLAVSTIIGYKRTDKQTNTQTSKVYIKVKCKPNKTNILTFSRENLKHRKHRVNWFLETCLKFKF